MTDVAWQSINSIRVLAMDAVEQAQSGHPGTPMALAPAAYVLWTRHLRYDPAAPDWPDRDRFILSCGHASMLLYSMLYLTGYDLSLDDIKAFRQWGSRTPGHPEHGDTVGVETSTGPLGQGLGNSVGMAMAERLLAAEFGDQLVNHRTWVFASDGDLMEGIGGEAASLAGHLRLGKLNVVYDNNHITIDGRTSLSFSEDVGKRFEAYGWHVQHVEDGNDVEAIDRALTAAAAETERPSMIVLTTIIGDPAPTKRDSHEAHGAPLGKAEVQATKKVLGWSETPFFVAPEALLHMRERAAERAAAHAEWRTRLAAVDKAAVAAFQERLSGKLPDGWDGSLPEFPAGGGLATRAASQQVLSVLVKTVPSLVGGSADLAGSTGTVLKDLAHFTPDGPGRIVHWGVREHVMASACNGLALHGGFRPYGATFLVFADYMKPSIRLAALMKLPVTYIFTHDSIGVGEDGPTHQPIEHLALLRAIPNMTVIRPGDANETREAWRVALSHTTGPTALILTRQKLPNIGQPTEGARRGGYVLMDRRADGRTGGTPDAIIIGTGSEVQVALAAAQLLEKEGHAVRVVSLPSWEVFAAQSQDYRDSVLPPSVRARVSVEAASDFGWMRWTTEAGESISINHFGASAPGERLFKEFGFTPERVAEAVRRVLARRSS
ncbi:MAG TPA: transketolase [Gemmatimonadales bacterium]|nr:transketolase [Gemmatimonadales bacterium]